jgi:hypothetical protein
MKNKFNLSHYKNLTFDMGQLVPIMCHEVLPGDIQQHYTDALLRVAPLNTPVMHPVKVGIHHFFVPSRIVWDSFEDFITGGDDGNDASVFPTITLTATEKSLADYLGIPIGTSLSVNALPFRAYAMIYNEYFRDKDLQTALTIDTTSGADTTTNTTLQNKCWEKDFFTTCRASEQKGSDVTLPLNGTASVTAPNSNNAAIVRLVGSGNTSNSASVSTNASGYTWDGTTTTYFDPNGTGS